MSRVFAAVLTHELFANGDDKRLGNHSVIFGDGVEKIKDNASSRYFYEFKYTCVFNYFFTNIVLVNEENKTFMVNFGNWFTNSTNTAICEYRYILTSHGYKEIELHPVGTYIHIEGASRSYCRKLYCSKGELWANIEGRKHEVLTNFAGGYFVGGVKY